MIDIEKTFAALTYFTNGDNLLDGYMIRNAIDRVIDNEDLRFTINYESGKQNSRRFYEIMSVDFSEDGEYGFNDFIQMDDTSDKDELILALQEEIAEKDVFLSQANQLIAELNEEIKSLKGIKND